MMRKLPQMPPVCEHVALQPEGTRYRVAWQERKKLLPEHLHPCRIEAELPNGTSYTVLISIVPVGMEGEYEADIDRLHTHSPVEQRRILHEMQWSVGDYEGNEVAVGPLVLPKATVELEPMAEPEPKAEPELTATPDVVLEPEQQKPVITPIDDSTPRQANLFG